jgi:hypothetical protein
MAEVLSPGLNSVSPFRTVFRKSGLLARKIHGWVADVA